MKNIEENREKIAMMVVDGMDLNDLIDEMVYRLMDEYEHDDEVFQESVEIYE